MRAHTRMAFMYGLCDRRWSNERVRVTNRVIQQNRSWEHERSQSQTGGVLPCSPDPCSLQPEGREKGREEGRKGGREGGREEGKVEGKEGEREKN